MSLKSFLGFMHEMHTDPKSGANLVCQRVRESVSHISEVYLDWVLVTASQVFRPLIAPVVVSLLCNWNRSVPVLGKF